MKTEKDITPLSGYLAISVLFVLALLSIISLSADAPLLGVPCMVLFLFVAKGMLVISPNSSKVFLLFGKYMGSIKQNGLFWVNPFYTRVTLSLRARNFESEK